MSDQPDEVPSMWTRWRALPASERRLVRRQVQGGGPVEPMHRSLGAWYAGWRLLLLSGLVLLAAGFLVAALVAMFLEFHPVALAFAVVLALSLWVNITELARVRRVRLTLAPPSDQP